jgi:hypothetical protein
MSVQILAFDNKEFVLSAIENAAPHVEKIFIAYSKEPFVYFKNARNYFKNTFDLNSLSLSPHIKKIEIIEGIWDYEEDMRNACLKAARECNYDAMFIQDPDEFYLKNDYECNVQFIKLNPESDFYFTEWINFWKSSEYVLVLENYQIKSESPPVAINLHSDTKFVSRRSINSQKSQKLPGQMYHLAYVRSNDEMFRKIKIWSHSNQVHPFFYDFKWKRWNEKSRFLHPCDGPSWIYARSHNLSLPKEIQEIKKPQFEIYEKDMWETWLEFFVDGILYIKHKKIVFKGAIYNLLKVLRL